jgi:hypothetical protein
MRSSISRRTVNENSSSVPLACLLTTLAMRVNLCTFPICTTDPQRSFLRTVKHDNATFEDVLTALGAGVHSAYENAMINANRAPILDSLATIKPIAKSKLVKTGRGTAQATVELMRTTFAALPPADIVQFFVDTDALKSGAQVEAMWERFGEATIEEMMHGATLLEALWEAAWTAGNGEAHIHSTKSLTVTEALSLIRDADFLPFHSIKAIGSILQ